MIKSSNLLIVNGNIFFKRDHDYNFKTRIHKKWVFNYSTICNWQQKRSTNIIYDDFWLFLRCFFSLFLRHNIDKHRIWNCVIIFSWRCRLSASLRVEFKRNLFFKAVEDGECWIDLETFFPSRKSNLLRIRSSLYLFPFLLIRIH